MGGGVSFQRRLENDLVFPGKFTAFITSAAVGQKLTNR